MPKISKFEMEMRKQYLEYCRANEGNGTLLSYKEWKKKWRTSNPNKDPRLYSLPFIRIYGTSVEPELPKY